MELFDILDKSCCAVDVCARSKEQMIAELARLAVHSDALKNRTADEIARALSAREAEGSTGFGNEIAIPHARIEGMERFLLYIVACRSGVKFEALDQRPIKLFFVILGPAEKVNEHLKLLASVSRTLGHTNVKNELIKSRSAVALHETFVRHTDVQPATSKEGDAMKLMVINIYDEDHLYQILEALLEEGVEGATVLDSIGMGHFLSRNPLFSSFTGFMRQNRHTSKVILAVVAETAIDAVVAAIESITGDLDTKSGAMILTLDVSFLKGNMNVV